MKLINRIGPKSIDTDATSLEAEYSPIEAMRNRIHHPKIKKNTKWFVYQFLNIGNQFYLQVWETIVPILWLVN